MFWKVNFRQPSAIEGLLDKEGVNLEEILDEDDVLQECKTQNKKLIDFLCKPDNLQQLVKFICTEPNDTDGDKVRFKYPHLACEILTAETFAIIEALTSSDLYLPMLWSFLDREQPMNPLIGSFTSKVLLTILSHRSTIFLDYIKNREGFIDDFLRHLGTSAFMDLLLQMMVPSENDQTKIELTVWLKDSGIIDKLLNCIQPEASVDQCINASQAICDMIRISRDTSQTTGPSPLLMTLESEETINKLLENMFSTDNPPDWTLVNGIMILLTTLERRVSTGYSPTLGSQSDDSRLAWDKAIERTLTSVCPRIKEFHNLLTRSPSCEPVSFTVCKLNPPLGNMRLRVVQLFSTLLQSQDPRIHKEIIQHRTCSVLLDLFFQFPWNNFLHTYVESSITAALSSTSSVSMETNDDTGQSDDSVTLRQHLLKECMLVQRLLEGASFNEEQLSQDRGCRQGYMGHLIRLANQIAGNPQLIGGMNPGSLTRHNMNTKPLEDGKLQEELDEDTFKKWDEFMNGQVTDMNKKNSTNLGGNRPMNSSIEDSDEEFDPLNMAPDNELEKSFQQYQEIHFTNQFMDDFGVNDDLEPAPIPYSTAYSNITAISCLMQADEEHTQAMAGFEAACQEKINQFDDESESDEDESSTWVEKELSLASPGDLHSSGEDDESMGSISKRRIQAHPSGSSGDDDFINITSQGGRIEPLIIGENKTSNGSDDLGMVWSSEFTTDEDLSGVRPIDTGGGALNWGKEQTSINSSTGSNPSGGNWANFSSFNNQPTTTVINVPVVATTYVSVSEGDTTNEGGSGPYGRLSSDSSDDIVMDENLLEMDGNNSYDNEGGGAGSTSDSSDDETNSSDEEKSGGYDVTASQGDSGSPLIPSDSPGNNPSSQCNADDVGDDKGVSTTENITELTDNYRFLSSKKMLSDESTAQTDLSSSKEDSKERLEDKTVEDGETPQST